MARIKAALRRARRSRSTERRAKADIFIKRPALAFAGGALLGGAFGTGTLAIAGTGQSARLGQEMRGHAGATEAAKTGPQEAGQSQEGPTPARPENAAASGGLRVLSPYGANGTKARRYVFGQTAESEGAALDFQTFYRAGRAGLDYGRAESMAAGDLPEMYRKAAFNAGERDAALSAAGGHDIIEQKGGARNGGEAERGIGRGIRRQPVYHPAGEAGPLSEERGGIAGQPAQERRDAGGSERRAVQGSGISRLNTEQQERLKNTVIRNTEGEPLEVAHWTPNLEFEHFNEGDIGFHFGNERQARRRAVALKHDPDSEGRIIRGYLDIRNPVLMSKDQYGWNAGQAAIMLWDADIISHDDYLQIKRLAMESGGTYHTPAAKALREILAAKGYDGISYPNDFEGEGLSHIAFYPEQVVIVDDGKGAGREREPVYLTAEAGKATAGKIDTEEQERRIAAADRQYGITEDENFGLKFYVGGWAYDWNRKQRTQEEKDWGEYDRESIGMARAALEKHPQYQGRTYRNLTFGHPDELPNAYENFLAEHALGKTVVLRAFTSASKDPNGYVVSGDKLAHLVIDGIRGRDISGSYSIPSQQEVVYLPGTRIQITKVTTANDGYPLIYAREVVDNGNVLGRDPESADVAPRQNHGGKGDAPGAGVDLVGSIHGDGGVPPGGGESGGIPLHKPGPLSAGRGSAGEVRKNAADGGARAGKEGIEAAGRLTDEERGAIVKYKSSEAYTLNEKLYSGAALSAADIGLIRQLDAALFKLPPFRGKTYRNISFDMQGREAYAAFLARHTPNAVLQYEAYTSASKAADGYEVDGDLVVHLEIKGSGGRDIASGLGREDEQEILYPRGTFVQVTEVGTAADGKPLIKMREVRKDAEGASDADSGERGAAMRELQEQAARPMGMQGVPEADTRGDTAGSARPQGAVSGGQRDTLRPEGPGASGGGPLRGGADGAVPGRPDMPKKQALSAEREEEADQTDASFYSEPEAWQAARLRDGAVKQPRPLREIVDKIRHDFGLQVTTGHIRKKGTMGQYHTWSEGIRLREANDLPTLAHELGHHLDKKHRILRSTMPQSNQSLSVFLQDGTFLVAHDMAHDIIEQKRGARNDGEAERGIGGGIRRQPVYYPAGEAGPLSEERGGIAGQPAQEGRDTGGSERRAVQGSGVSRLTEDNGDGGKIHHPGGRLGLSQNDTSGQAAAGDAALRRNAGDIPTRGKYAGGDGQIYLEDSEGRRINPEHGERLRGTAIADTEGRPAAVYHFTPNMEFTTFAKGDVGFHFGTLEQAGGRAKRKGVDGRTLRGYLNIRNPLYVPTDIMNWHANATAMKMWSDGLLTKDELREIWGLASRGLDYDSPASIRLRELLAAKGYDGISYPNDFEGEGLSYIAFYPEQVIITDDGKGKAAETEGGIRYDGQGAGQGTDDVSAGGGERDAGAGAGGQAGVLAAGAGRDQGGNSEADQGRRAAERKDRLRNLGTQRISPAALGLDNGTRRAALWVIPEAAYDDELAGLQQKLRRDGWDVVFFAGDMELILPDGTPANMRGVYQDGVLYVKADHAQYTASQIAEHETFHGIAESAPDIVGRVLDAIRERHGAREIERIAEQYILDYRGCYGAEDITPYIEEVLADAYAGINSFARGADKYTDIVRRTISERTGESIARAQQDAQRGPPEQRYSADKRTAARFNALGRFTPFGGTKRGSIKKIAYQGEEGKGENLTGSAERGGGPRDSLHERKKKSAKPLSLGGYPQDQTSKTQGGLTSENILSYTEDENKRKNRAAEEKRAEAGEQQDTYANLYDAKALALTGIEEPDALGRETGGKTAVFGPTSDSTISVADLLSLVKGEAAKYVPQARYSLDVTEDDFTYEALAAKPDMLIVRMQSDAPRRTDGSIDRTAVLDEALRRVRERHDGREVVYIRDIGREARITKAGLRHGLNRRLEARAAALLHIGDILENAIVVNTAAPEHSAATDAYVAAGLSAGPDGSLYVTNALIDVFSDGRAEIARLDEVYSINTKRGAKIEPAVPKARVQEQSSLALTGSIINITYFLNIVKDNTKQGAKIEPAAPKARVQEQSSLALTGSTINIADFLNIVKDYFPDILSADVLRHYGMRRGERPAVRGLRYSMDDNENGYPRQAEAFYTDAGLYSYAFLTSRPDMEVTLLPDMSYILNESGRVERAAVAAQGMENAAAQGFRKNGRIYVENNYTGRALRIDKDTTTHSVDGDWRRIKTNGRLGAVAGELAKRAIPINALRNENSQAKGTYAMAAYARDERGRDYVAIITVEQMTERISDVSLIDTVHAISGRIKKGDSRLAQGHPVTAVGADPGTSEIPTISIVDFLDIVNQTHQSILSDDVLAHYGAERDRGSYWGRRAALFPGIPDAADAGGAGGEA